MDANTLQAGVDVYVSANATLEAAKITAAATVAASQNTIYAATIATFAGFAAILAAYVNTWHARRTYKGERDAYRYLIGGHVAQLIVSIEVQIWEADFHLDNKAKSGELYMYVPRQIKLPPELGQDQWKVHAILGAKFARTLVAFREGIDEVNRNAKLNPKGWNMYEEWSGFISPEQGLKRHIDVLKKLSIYGRTMDACTKTSMERVRDWTTARRIAVVRRLKAWRRRRN